MGRAVIEPSLALQTLIHSRLTGSPTVTALVSADDIADVSGLPTVFPCIIIGEGHALYSDRFNRFHEQAYADLHIWTTEPSLEQAKTIAAAIREALWAPWQVEGFIAHGISVRSSRFLRDPDGLHGHAVMSIDAVLQARA